MTRSEREAARIAMLEERSAQLEYYMRRVAALEEENRRLRERLASHEQPVSSKRPPVPSLPRLPFQDAAFEHAVDAQDWARAIAALERHAASPDPRIAVPVLCHIGAMALDALGDIEHAAEAFVAALNIDPNLDVARHHLASIYREAGSWAHLEELLAQRVTTTTNDDLRLAWLLELGEINENHLRNASNAAEAYQGALDLDPSNARATAGLQRLGLL